MNPPIIVTGGAGFIGSNIVAALNERGEKNIIIVDHLGSGEKWKNLRGLKYEDFVNKDEFIADIKSRKIAPASAVIHMGACSATTERDADYLMRNNFHYTRDLCTWCLETNARFITASSAATYGDGALGYSDDDSASLTLKPLNMYGYSKQLFDEWALRHDYYRRIVGLKFFNVFGPREGHKGDMRSVVHKAYYELLDKKTISLFKSDRQDYGDGEQKRDFIYVKDAVDVVLYFLENLSANGLFNCGTGKARTWKDLAEAIFKSNDRRVNINWIEMPAQLKGKYQYFTEADTTKLRAAGYAKEFTSLENSVADYVKWLAREES